MGRFILAAALLWATAAAQQKPASPRTTPKPEAAPAPLPTYNIVLSPIPDISAPVPDEVDASVAQCDGAGNPYFAVEGENDAEFVGLTSKGVVTFPAKKITDIPSPHMETAFVTPSGLLALTFGKEPGKEEGDEQGNPIKDFMAKGEMRVYVARFDLDGSYKGALKLDLKFLPMQIAAFESGNFLIAGLDQSNVARVALMDPSGELLRYVELPRDIAENPKAVERSCGNSPFTFFCGDMSSVAMSAGFFPYRGRILFLRGLDASRIYEIRDSGEVRMVKTKNTAGLNVDDLLPSDRNWFAHSGDEFLEVNPETGELLGRYRVAGTSKRDNLACYLEGKFVGLRHEDGKVTLLTGSAERTAGKPAVPSRKR